MREIAADPGPKVIFNVGDGKATQAMYYADCPAYPDVPSDARLRDLIRSGRRVHLLADFRGTRVEPFRRIEEAGLAGHVKVIRLPPPRRAPARHPYWN